MIQAKWIGVAVTMVSFILQGISWITTTIINKFN